MDASALPVAVNYFLLWTPPQNWSVSALFWYLPTLAMIIRTAITFCEAPSSALLPELTSDYDRRSSLMAYRHYFGWTGGNLMSVLMFVAIFPAMATAAIPNGQFNRDAYALYGLISAGMIFTAILVSALGTHGRIAHLTPAPARRRLTPGQIFREILETLANRSFAALFGANIIGLPHLPLFLALSHWHDFAC